VYYLGISSTVQSLLTLHTSLASTDMLPSSEWVPYGHSTHSD